VRPSFAIAVTLLCTLAPPALRAQEPTHPLDDLTSAEHWTLRQTPLADSRVSDDIVPAGFLERNPAIDLPH